jgi:hypothetical protein
MTNFPDLEAAKVCPGHIPQSFVPELGYIIQLTTDTCLDTVAGDLSSCRLASPSSAQSVELDRRWGPLCP